MGYVLTFASNHTPSTKNTAFGSQAAAQFTPLWSNHVTALFNYARGLADHDFTSAHVHCIPVSRRTRK